MDIPTTHSTHHYLNLIFCFILIPGLSFAQTVEAENGVLNGVRVSTQRTGYFGSGYVTGIDEDGDRLTMKIYAGKGVYKLYVRYASPYGDKFNFIYVNGDNMGSVFFPMCGTFAETKIGKVYLHQGDNVVAIVKEWGFIDVDNIRLEPSSASDIANIASAVVVPSPSGKSDSVYQMLARLYGKAILSGQYGGTAEFDRIRSVSGKTPVIRGFDLIDYSPSRVERGATSTETEKAMEWGSGKGLVTLCWHWNAPKDLIDQPSKEWWRGFYAEATTFDLTRAMRDPSSEEYTLIVRDIDAIAFQLKKLKEENVPVLWRPLHEAEGKWFWWGAHGAEACKWLWKLLFDRLVNYHGLNNLIWVWTSTGTPHALNWYPGDEFVDIIAADIYNPPGSYGSNFITFDNIASIYGGKKIISLSENGPIPDPDKLFEQGAAWSWFSTWSGNFITDGYFNSQSHIEKVFNHEYVITLDEVDRIDEIIMTLEEKRIKQEHGPVTAVNDEDAMVFENPLKNHRLVVRNTGHPATIIVCDLQGRKHFPIRYAAENQYAEFDFSQKASGIYILKVISSRTVSVHRILLP